MAMVNAGPQTVMRDEYAKLVEAHSRAPGNLARETRIRELYDHLGDTSLKLPILNQGVGDSRGFASRRDPSRTHKFPYPDTNRDPCPLEIFQLLEIILVQFEG